jgi:7-carboxy-7-deazaguanine synthase
MPEPSILKINEIFWSFQGEGLRCGEPSIFIRLAGCSLRCPYCDTTGSWDSGKDRSIPEIMEQISPLLSQYPLSQIVITGGEPLEQDLAPLTNALKKRDLFISIETNGFHFKAEFKDKNRLPIDWWTVSPKDVSRYYVHPTLAALANEIKLIANRNLTLETIRKIRSQIPSTPIFLQPDATDPHRFQTVFNLFRLCQHSSLPSIRPGIQLHKVYDVE